MLVHTGGKLSWKGSWIGATTATVADLTDDDFLESANKFDLDNEGDRAQRDRIRESA